MWADGLSSANVDGMAATHEFKFPATREGFVAMRDAMTPHWDAGFRVTSFEHLPDGGGSGILRVVLSQTALGGPPATTPPWRVAIAKVLGTGATNPSTVYTWTSDGWEGGTPNDGEWNDIVDPMTTNDGGNFMPLFQATRTISDDTETVWLLSENEQIAAP